MLTPLFDLLLAVSFKQLIHALSELDVKAREALFVVRSQCDVDCVPKIAPIRVVLVLFGELRRASHEQESLLKVIKDKASLNSIAGLRIRNISPLRDTSQGLLGLIRS